MVISLTEVIVGGAYTYRVPVINRIPDVFNQVNLFLRIYGLYGRDKRILISIMSIACVLQIGRAHV